MKYDKDEVNHLIQNNFWKKVSLYDLPIEVIEEHKIDLDWQIIATNRNITNDFYINFKEYLDPHKNVIELRSSCGFIFSMQENEDNK